MSDGAIFWQHLVLALISAGSPIVVALIALRGIRKVNGRLNDHLAEHDD